MNAFVGDLTGARIEAEMAAVELADLETKIKASENLENIANLKSQYAASYDEFVKVVNPRLIPNDGHYANDQVTQTRMSPIGEWAGARVSIGKVADEATLEDAKDNALAVHGVLSKMSVDQRVDLMNAFKDVAMQDDALNPVLSLMTTVGVGKSASAAKGEMGKAVQWFDFLAQDEQKAVIKDFANKGVKDAGFHVRDGKGKDITSFDQLGGKVNATAYEAADINVNRTNDHGEVLGNGITFSQPPKNYPFALGVGDPLLAMFAGNGTIMKVPEDMQDIMDTFALYWNQHVAQYAEEHQAELGLDNDDVAILKREKTMQVVTGRGYEKVATNARVVSSLETGRQVYNNYVDAKGPDSVEAQRFAAELAGANVMYVGPDLSDAELDLAAKQWLSRVVDNMGMICTKIEDGMVHEDIAEKFQALVAKKWEEFDASTVGQSHGGAAHGVHTDPNALKVADEYLKEARELGANVIGGELSEDGLSMTPAMVFWDDDNMGKHLSQRQKNIENFAPISNFMPVRDVDQAIAITELSSCNLTSSIWTKDSEAIGKFIKETKLGSYNVFNPKHGSDNAPYGEHAGLYHNVSYINPRNAGEKVTLHIESNGVTGGHSQIAAQLDVDGVQHGGKAIHVDGDTYEKMRDEGGQLAVVYNVKALAASGVDFARDTQMSADEIRAFVEEHEDVSLQELAPSLRVA
ncbi:MAG: aldehyde dehydrogenase family protein [Bdellovibrionales bacterium]